MPGGDRSSRASRGSSPGLETMTPYREVAAELGTSESVVKTTVHRLRERFGVVLRAEIADTVSSPDQVDDEVKHLLGVIAPWARPPS